MFTFFASSICIFTACIASAAESCATRVAHYTDSFRVGAEFREIAARTSRVGDIEHLKATVGAPPEHGGRKHCAEISYLSDLQVNSETVEQIRCEVDLDCWRFRGIQYSDLAELGYSKTVLLLEVVRWHLDQKLFTLKLHFNRARPSQVSLSLSPVISDPGHPSYPSGHAAQAYLLALVLAEVMPEDRPALLRDAKRISENRETAKLHFPSDTEAGIRLARAMFEALQRENWFRLSLRRATLEWDG